ncbi:signal transduction protein, partial [Clostridium perfringens]
MKPLKSVNLFPVFSEIQTATTAQEIRDERIACQNHLIE